MTKTIKHQFSGSSLLEFLDKFGTDEKGFYDNNWWKSEKFAKEKPPKRTYEIVFHPDWNNLTYQGQLKKTNKVKEEFLHPAVLAEAILTHYKKTGKRLMENWWSRTSSVDSSGFRVYVGYFDSDGLLVYNYSDDHRYDYVGVASARKFKSLKTGNLDTLELCKNCKHEKKGYCEYWKDEITKNYPKLCRRKDYCSAFETKPELLIIPKVLKLIDQIKIFGSDKSLKVQIKEVIKNKYKI